MSTDVDQSPAELLRRAAKEERRLLRQEQAAERDLLAASNRLASAQLRLEKQQSRVERRRARVAAATEELRRRQAARAAGPDGLTPTALAELPAVVEPTPPPVRDDATIPAPLDQPAPTGIDGAVEDAAPRQTSTRRRTTPPRPPQ